MTRRFEIGDNIYTIAIYADQNDILTVSRNGKHKTVKVIDSVIYRYKLRERFIESRDGAKGIYKFISDCFDKNFMVCLAEKILNHAIDNMNEKSS